MSVGGKIPKLGQAGLQDFPAHIARPMYDRSRLTPGIVHIGLGNFHRAHQSWYLHRLMQMGEAHDWAIIGAGVRPYDAVMREKLLAQDCLTTLIELRPDGRSVEIVGSMIDYLPIEEGNAPLIKAMSDPAIRIVALTVTEGGYYIDPQTGGLDESHPDIRHDVANPASPMTVFGAMVAALDNRRSAGLSPFTGLCCDNLQGNGDVLRCTVISLARLKSPDLAAWIEDHGCFPNSMVDCIVPATGPQEIALVKDFGIDDAVPVTHEDFRQWVIEDKFCAGRPDWDKVGATFSDRVHDYETMKIRVLNAGHQVIANAGEVLSLQTIADCMAHPLILGLFRKVQAEEITPYVKTVPGMEPDAYATLIETRFKNPAIHDTVRRVAFDGSSRHSGFVLPVLRDALAFGGSVNGLALVEALWARMCFGSRENGTRIEPNDPIWETLMNAAGDAKDRPLAWLEQSDLYGDLAEAETFIAAFEAWLAIIWSDGTEAALERYLSG